MKSCRQREFPTCFLEALCKTLVRRVLAGGWLCSSDRQATDIKTWLILLCHHAVQRMEHLEPQHAASLARNFKGFPRLDVRLSDVQSRQLESR